MISTMGTHEFDPRVKLVAVIVLSTLAILIQDIFYLLILFILSIVILLYFNVNISELYPRIKKFLPLFFTLLIIQSIFSPSGVVLLTFNGLDIITLGGIIKGICVVLRIFTVIASARILATSSTDDIILSLVKLKIPYEIAFMVLLAIRFLPILMEEFTDAITAIQLRGVEIEKISFGRKLHVYMYIFMPVVAGAVLRAKKVAIAMEARAFRAYPNRTYINDLTITLKDYLLIIMFLFFGIGFYGIYIIRG